MSAFVPIDPLDLDRLPPADLFLCDHCGGTGGIWPTSGDPQDVTDCPVCLGEGVLPEYLGSGDAA